MLAGKRRPIRRRLFAFFGSGNPPAPGFFRIGRIGNIDDQVGSFFDARQHGADVRVLAVGEPHAVHAFSGEFETADLARLGGIFDAVDLDAGFVGCARRQVPIEIRPLLILDQDIAGDLDFVRVRVGRMRHLRDHAWIARIGHVDDAQRHRRSAEMSQVNVTSLLQHLHAVAVTVQIMMADHPHVPTFAFRLDIRDRHIHPRFYAELNSRCCGQVLGSVILPKS